MFSTALSSDVVTVGLRMNFAFVQGSCQVLIKRTTHSLSTLTIALLVLNVNFEELLLLLKGTWGLIVLYSSRVVLLNDWCPRRRRHFLSVLSHRWLLLFILFSIQEEVDLIHLDVSLSIQGLFRVALSGKFRSFNHIDTAIGALRLFRCLLLSRRHFSISTTIDIL